MRFLFFCLSFIIACNKTDSLSEKRQENIPKGVYKKYLVTKTGEHFFNKPYSHRVKGCLLYKGEIISPKSIQLQNKDGRKDMWIQDDLTGLWISGLDVNEHPIDSIQNAIRLIGHLFIAVPVKIFEEYRKGIITLPDLMRGHDFFYLSDGFFVFNPPNPVDSFYTSGSVYSIDSTKHEWVLNCFGIDEYPKIHWVKYSEEGKRVIGGDCAKIYSLRNRKYFTVRLIKNDGYVIFQGKRFYKFR